ncbi:hypothetical protein [Klebsiella michiganensis]|uniref:hypothetical protein n=1 Tax=Klebsiella michiganensis TaxID=1134687 RepID=UPI0035D9B65F|nr:hypothetical protein [Klebsiella oxytoca]
MNNDGLTLNQLAERNAVLVTEVEKLSAERDQLAAENVELKSFGGTLHEIKSSLVGGGHGHMAKADMQAQSAVMDVIFDAFDAIETPATDRIVAGIKADGRVEGAHFVANRMLAAWDAGFIEDTAKNAADIARMILASTEFMAGAPEGDFDRSFADGILEDIAQQLREGADK